MLRARASRFQGLLPNLMSALRTPDDRVHRWTPSTGLLASLRIDGRGG